MRKIKLIALVAVVLILCAVVVLWKISRSRTFDHRGTQGTGLQLQNNV